MKEIMEQTGKRSIASIFIMALCILSLNGYAQTLTEAQQEYNSGIQKLEDQPKEALEHFRKAIEISEDLGPDAETVMIQSENQLPIAHYNIARNAYKNRDLEAAIESFKKASEMGEMYNEDVKEKADKVLAQYYTNKGKKAYSGEKFDQAQENYEMAKKYHPEDPELYYFVGLSHRKKEEYGEMKSSFKQAIELGKENNDMGTARKAEQMAVSTYLQLGINAREQGNFEQSVSYFKDAGEFDPENPEPYYGMATAYNKISEYDQAIEAANKALENAGTEKSKTAKIYYELGLAYKGKNNKAQACEAFKNAAYGDYKASAEYEIKNVLECN